MHLIKKTNAFVVRLLIVKHLTEFSLRAFVLQVVLPVAAVSVCSAMVPVLLKVMIKSTVAEFFAVVFSSAIFCGVFILLFGLKKSERNTLILKIRGWFCRG